MSATTSEWTRLLRICPELDFPYSPCTLRHPEILRSARPPTSWLCFWILPAIGNQNLKSSICKREQRTQLELSGLALQNTSFLGFTESFLPCTPSYAQCRERFKMECT